MKATILPEAISIILTKAHRNIEYKCASYFVLVHVYTCVHI